MLEEFLTLIILFSSKKKLKLKENAKYCSSIFSTRIRWFTTALTGHLTICSEHHGYLQSQVHTHMLGELT